MEWTTATAQALAVKTCRGKYGWPEYNTGDGIALRPATRALEAVEPFTGAPLKPKRLWGIHDCIST